MANPPIHEIIQYLSLDLTQRLEKLKLIPKEIIRQILCKDIYILHQDRIDNKIIDVEEYYKRRDKPLLCDDKWGRKINKWNRGLIFACFANEKKIVDYVIKKGANDWDRGLKAACLGNNIELVNYMMEKGVYNLDIGLEGACIGNNRELVEYMIKKGARDWNIGLQGACIGNSRELADYMIEKGASSFYGLFGACLGNSRELVDYMIELGEDSWYWGLVGACSGNNRELVNYMIKKGAYNFTNEVFFNDPANILYLLQEGNSREIFKGTVDFSQVNDYNKLIFVVLAKSKIVGKNIPNEMMKLISIYSQL